MKVIKADEMGMCFGVKEAVSKAFSINNAEEVTIYGELVHNQQVFEKLKKKGFKMLSENDRSKQNLRQTVLITAHGISRKESNRLKMSGKFLIDTTCPLVSRIHLEVKSFEEGDYKVIVIGRRNHVEVKGITGDLSNYRVVESIYDVKRYEENKIGVLCQSTASPDLAMEILSQIKRLNAGKEIKFVNTICKPTLDRQMAVKKLIAQVEALVVVGGRNSNNTIQLVSIARQRNLPAFHIEKAQDIDPEWFTSFSVVGLTAGTSTLDSTIDEVYHTLSTLKNENKIHTTKGENQYV